MHLPFEDNVFDACTIGFGLRNLPDYQLGINEMTRVLAQSGRLAILEMTRFPDSLLRPLFELYFGQVVPVIGGIVSRDREAYRYLPESVRNFPSAVSLAEMMHAAGLVDVRWRFFGGGAVALHVGTKPEEPVR
jgi:demethylmenaquinone methyltransferase/2-methoxy-6-polyprenyl-1,4-benzoquinol methylase